MGVYSAVMPECMPIPPNARRRLAIAVAVGVLLLGAIAVFRLSNASRTQTTALADPRPTQEQSVDSPSAAPRPDVGSPGITPPTEEETGKGYAALAVPTPKPDLSHCSGLFSQKITRKTPETRKEFAQEANKKTPGAIAVYTGGDSNEYLLFVTTPEHEMALRELIAGVDWNEDNLCIEGFDSLQFIVRDQNMNQTLVSEVKTNVHATMHRASQTAFATPMR